MSLRLSTPPNWVDCFPPITLLLTIETCAAARALGFDCYETFIMSWPPPDFGRQRVVANVHPFFRPHVLRGYVSMIRIAVPDDMDALPRIGTRSHVGARGQFLTQPPCKHVRITNAKGTQGECARSSSWEWDVS